jgi:hypothetical protein
MFMVGGLFDFHDLQGYPWTHIKPKLILQQTLPYRIVRPRSVNVRQLGDAGIQMHHEEGKYLTK